MSNLDIVSPITIRLRILKEYDELLHTRGFRRFTHHDPLEDTERAVESWGHGRY